MRGPSSIKCSCGFHNDPWRLFCGGCGAKLGPACASCGFVNVAVAFCGGCGTGIGEAKPRSAPATVPQAKPTKAPAAPATRKPPAEHNQTIPIVIDDLDVDPSE